MRLYDIKNMYNKLQKTTQNKICRLRSEEPPPPPFRTCSELNFM